MIQLSLFDQPDHEPEIGEWFTETGAVISHIMRPNYIGKKVLINCSTQSRRWYRCGILEKYIPHEGRMRSVVYTGDKQRSLITHYPGIEIYECLPWDAYEKRMKSLGGQHDTQREVKGDSRVRSTKY